MSRLRQYIVLLGCSILAFTAACTPAASSFTPDTAAILIGMTETPDRVLDASSTAADTAAPATVPPPSAAQPAATATATAIPTTAQPSLTPITPPPTRAAESPPCTPDLCNYTPQYFLARPVAPPDNDAVDITYRFGSTQGGRREPHYGVEFLNSYGTTVLAAADGLVVVAGDDREPTSEHGVWPITFYGPFSYFYGNLVVIEHHMPDALVQAFPDIPQPLYTLYAHLSAVSVEVGQTVKTGQPVGQVGMSGVATGNHLHFEVRLGENTYASARNPELWLIPRQDETGQRMGGFAGQVIDEWGNYAELNEGIVLQRLPEGPEGPKDLEFYTLAYEEKALVGLSPWQEGFAIGDLPAGLYRVTLAYRGLRQYLVEILPGQLSMATFRIAAGD